MLFEQFRVMFQMFLNFRAKPPVWPPVFGKLIDTAWSREDGPDVITGKRMETSQRKAVQCHSPKITQFEIKFVE